MRTDELATMMQGTEVPTAPDLARITGRGRRLVARRRAAVGGVALLCAAAIATPLTLGAGGERHHETPPVLGRPAEFEPARPMGDVADTGDKFYFGAPGAVGGSSLGPEAVWVEAGDPPYRLTFGFHDEATGRLMRAGSMTVPATTGKHVELPALPRQSEPTYVGMFRLPAGADAKDYSVAVEAGGHTAGMGPTRVRQSGSVRPGYLVYWVTAAEDLASRHGWWAVEDAHGRIEVSGGFQPQPQAAVDLR
jgi:hypothetical protein